MENQFCVITNLKGTKPVNSEIYRIFNGFCNIIQLCKFNLKNGTIEDIKTILFECLKEFVSLEKVYLDYCLIENETIDKLISGEGFDFANKTLTWQNPTYELKKLFRDFMIYSAIILRYRMKIAKKILDISDNSYDKIKQKVIAKLNERKRKIGDEKFNEYIQMIDSDSLWGEELFKIRGKVEHVENNDIDISEVTFKITNEGVRYITPPLLTEEKYYLRKYMFMTFYNLFTYIEDYSYMLLNLYAIDCFDIKKKKNLESIIDSNIENIFRVNDVDVGKFEFFVDLNTNK